MKKRVRKSGWPFKVKIKKYHDRKGVTIYYGLDDWDGKRYIVVTITRKRFSKSKAEFFDNIFYEPPEGESGIPSLGEFYEIKRMLYSDPCAWRWFKNIAYSFRFSGKPLGEWIDRETLRIPFDEIEKCHEC